jgi:nucleotide-binding universal stress UspA family protein/RimJ/RimL family protein N-acetyltransferase
MLTARRTRVVKLRDGSRVRLRPISASDKELLVAAFDRLSEESRYRRYFHHMRELTPEMLINFTEVDHVDHEAIVAIDQGTGEALGVARYVRFPDDASAADLAVGVVDHWQGRGLGRALLTELTRRARQEGVRTFCASVLHGNEQAVGLLAGINKIERHAGVGGMQFRIQLPEKRGIGAQLAVVLRAAAAGVLNAGGGILPLTTRSESQAPGRRSIGTIIVGSDGSATASVAVRAAVEIAKARGATLHLVTAYRSSAQRQEAMTTIARTEDRIRELGVEPRTHARQGEAAPVLVVVAEEHDADLIVVGSSTVSNEARLRGSIPNALCRRAPCSLLIVRNT